MFEVSYHSFFQFDRLVGPCDCDSETGEEATGQRLFTLTQSRVTATVEQFTPVWQDEIAGRPKIRKCFRECASEIRCVPANFPFGLLRLHNRLQRWAIPLRLIAYLLDL